MAKILHMKKQLFCLLVPNPIKVATTLLFVVCWGMVFLLSALQSVSAVFCICAIFYDLPHHLVNLQVDLGLPMINSPIQCKFLCWIISFKRTDKKWEEHFTKMLSLKTIHWKCLKFFIQLYFLVFTANYANLHLASLKNMLNYGAKKITILYATEMISY